MRKTLLVVSLVALFAAPASGQQTGGAMPTIQNLIGDSEAGEPMGLVDLLGIESIGTPRLSPDGRTILFPRVSADWAGDRTVSHLWAVGIDGSGLRQMTNGPTSESSPRWAPDGRRFVFLADRSEARDTAQLHLMALDGGEAVQLSDHATGVRAPAWSADGDWVYFLAEEPKSDEEKEREEDSGGAVSYPRNWKHTHLFRVAAAGGVVEQVSRGDFSVWSYDLGNDGDTVALTRASTPLLDELPEVELYLLTLSSGQLIRLTDNPGVPESNPALSPDGRFVAFTADALPERGGQLDFYYESNLFVLPVEGGEPRVLAPGMAGEVEQFAWTAGGWLLAQMNLGVHSELYRFDPTGGAAPTALTGWSDTMPSGSVEGFHLVAGRGLVMRRAAPDNPGDLWYAVTEPFDARRVTRLHGAMRSRWALPRAEVVRWAGADGSSVEGILWYPLGYEEGRRYPLVVQIHGGPASSVQLTFPGSWGNYVPVWAAQGFAVLQPNYRGGVGYGDAFLRDMVGEYFHQADSDVYTGVDALIERGIVDPTRTAIMGWSAGGHMTNWVVTQTDRFAAASSGAGAANWTSMYAQSDVRLYRTPWFGGTPWQADAPLHSYLENSPAFNAHRARTPTLILVGERDMRVPMAQSIEMYRALKHSGAPTRLVTFPGEPHGLRTLRHRLHKMNVELAWILRHLGGEWTLERPPAGE